MESVEKVNKELNEILDVGIGYIMTNCFFKILDNIYEDFKKSEYYKGENEDEEFNNYLSSRRKKDS